MYLGRTLAIFGALYFAIHIISGTITCANEFCPGDSEQDWVYEYEDEDGKKVVVVEGKKLSEDDYERIKHGVK